MEPLSSVVLLKALDGLEARVTAQAENIANDATPGYRPMRVSFEAALAQAAAKGPDAVRAVQPRFERDVALGDDKRPGLELAQVFQTAARYSAVMEVLSRQMQLQSLAMKGG